MSQDAPKWGILPHHLFQILLEDSVDLPDLDLTWPDAELTKRRDLQALVKRFYAQILYGCRDSRCRTSTCATRQKRAMNGRSHADSTGLNGLSKSPGEADPGNASRRPFRSFTELSARALALHLASQDRAETRLCPYLPAQADIIRRRNAPRQDHLPRAAAEAAADSSPETTKRKDPKSFAQNFFGTVAVESFYTTLLYPRDFSSSEKRSVVANSPATDQLAEPHDADQASTHVHNRSPGYHGPTTSQRSVSHDVPDMTQDRRAVPEPPKVPQTLTHLSLRNIKALVKLLQECERISLEAQPSVKAPGPDAFNVTRMAKILQVCAAQSMYYVFSTPAALGASLRKTGKDLSSCSSTGRAALGASLREDRINFSSCSCTPSIDFGRMVQAFYWLRKFDWELQVAVATLPVAIKSLYVISSVRAMRKDRRSSRGSGRERTSQRDRKVVEYEIEDEREAAHLALQVFAVLVALTPPCTLTVWNLVYTCHQSGKMVPDGVQDSAMIRNVQLVLDIFEDEATMNLLSSLCKALATRLWVSDVECVTPELQRTQGTEVPSPRRSVAKCILDHLFRSQHFPVAYPTRNGQWGWKYDAPQPGEHSANAPRYMEIIAEWLRYFVSKHWDGKAEIDRCSAVGGALELLWYFDHLNESPVNFQIPVMEVRFDWLKLSTDWRSRRRIENPQHILTYPFLFSVKSQIACFRALNYAWMFQSYEDSIVASRLLAQMSFPDPLTSRGEVRVQDKLGNLLKNYFVIEIRRESVLLDAIAQLWRREERDLMKPLKVRMGMDEGEEGVDHGGVQQEFFRLAVAEIMNPDYGMFTVDDESGMSWFRPCSLEPMYKFELVGLLFGLAIYNGLTLPVNFPLAFYRKLQGQEVTKTVQIKDGWPTLAKGLESLLAWSDGDVGDVFARTYEFTAEGPGFNLTVDMEKNGRTRGWVPAYLNPDYCCRYCSSIVPPNVYETPAPPKAEAPNSKDAKEEKSKAPLQIDLTSDNDTNTEKKPFSPLASPVSVAEAKTSAQPSEPLYSPGDGKSEGQGVTRSGDEDGEGRGNASSSPVEASLVTNANREQYVSDYIFWLTNKSIRPQFEAFADNFYTCISMHAPTLLNVRDFKRLVEGSQDISVEALRLIANYDGGYTRDHPTIIDFWDIVRDFSPQQIGSLLEFATASDRIPATGMGSVQFSVQKNGEGDERLPTSMTCYGRLLLPQYSGKAVLREKLCLAIENSKGFGVA